MSLIDVLIDLFVPLCFHVRFDILSGSVPGRQRMLAGFWR